MTTETRTGLVAFGLVFGFAGVVGGVVAVGAGGAVSPAPVATGGGYEAVTASELYRQHKENVAACAARWDGARVEVSGEVAGNGLIKDRRGYRLPFRNEHGHVLSVDALFTSTTPGLLKVKPGDQVRVRGRIKADDHGGITVHDPQMVGG